MTTRISFRIALLLIAAEACCGGMGYAFVASVFHSAQRVSVLSFVIMALLFATGNIYLATKRIRYLTIFLVNLLLVFAGLWLTLGHGSLNGLRFPAGVENGINYFCAYFLTVGLCIRAVILVRRPKPEVYLNFDLYLAILFCIYFFAGLAGFRLPGQFLWLVIFFGIYLTALHLNYVLDAEDNQIGTRSLFIFGSLLVFFAAITEPLFRMTVKPAGLALDTMGVVFGILGQAAIFIIKKCVALSDLLHKFAIKEEQGVSGSDSASEIIISDKMDHFPLLLYLLVGVIILLALFLLGYLLYLLVCWLMRRKEPIALSPVKRNGKAWASLRRFLKSLFDRISEYLTLFLPGSFSDQQAYRYLLLWGIYHRLPRRRHETPYEYLERLKKNFPRHGPELGIITENFVGSHYSRNYASGENVKRQLRRLYRLGR